MAQDVLEQAPEILPAQPQVEKPAAATKENIFNPPKEAKDAQERVGLFFKELSTVDPTEGNIKALIDATNMVIAGQEPSDSAEQPVRLMAGELPAPRVFNDVVTETNQRISELLKGGNE